MNHVQYSGNRGTRIDQPIDKRIEQDECRATHTPHSMPRVPAEIVARAVGSLEIHVGQAFFDAARRSIDAAEQDYREWLASQTAGPESKLDAPVCELNLSQWHINQLEANGAFTVDLAAQAIRSGEIRTWTNFGPMRIIDVRKAIEEFGVQISQQ